MKNFTKIAHKNEPWRDVVMQDIDKVPDNPLFVLAGRFKVYRLKIYHQENSEKKIMFLIEGDKILKERCFINLEIDLQYNMVVNVKLKRALLFDGETCYLLKMALLVRLRGNNTYYFPAKILKDLK